MTFPSTVETLWSKTSRLRIEAIPTQKRVNHEGAKAQSYHEGEIFVKSLVPLCRRGKILSLDTTWLGSSSPGETRVSPRLLLKKNKQ
jgi:hypothetical protein